MCETKVYAAWHAMKERCTNKNHHAYVNYGGRGITFSKDWESFEQFYADMGEPKGLTLERQDNSKGYSKENCYWATHKENNNNRRNTIKITYREETRTLSEWAEKLNIKYGTLFRRYSNDWPVDRMLKP